MSTSPYVYTQTHTHREACLDSVERSKDAVYLCGVTLITSLHRSFLKHFCRGFTELYQGHWICSILFIQPRITNHKVGFSICKEYDIVCPPTLDSSEAKKNKKNNLLSRKKWKKPKEGPQRRDIQHSLAYLHTHLHTRTHSCWKQVRVRQDPACNNAWQCVLFHAFLGSWLFHWC